MKILINILLFLSLCTASCSAKTATDTSKADRKLYIREIMEKYYSDSYFFMGASARTEYLRADNPLYNRWLKEFSYNTPENDFKQSKVFARPGAAWRNEDYMKHIEIARQNRQVIRAHGPISPQCSKWIKEDARTAQEMTTVLQAFVSGLSKEVQANSDVVKWMDVVNETFCGTKIKGCGYDASSPLDDVIYQADEWFGPRTGTDKWENPWTVIGFDHVQIDGEELEIPKYIRMAFEIAQQNAPNVKLIYNEHGKTMIPTLWDKLKKTVLYLRSQNLRVDGIGWQAHIKLGWEKEPENIRLLQDMIAWCFDNQLEFHITELDITVSSKDTEMNMQVLKDTRQQQAETIGVVLETMLQNIGKGACGLNFWTMTDRFKEGNTFAVLFDTEGNPQPAYYKVKELLLKYAAQ